MSNIKWEYYIWEDEHPATLDQIKSVEEKLNIIFPSDYVEMVLQHQGMSPEPSSFKAPGLWKTGLCNLWHFSDDSNEEDSHILYMHGSLIQLDKDDSMPKLTKPEKIIPFGRTGGGEDLCFQIKGSGSLEINTI